MFDLTAAVLPLLAAEGAAPDPMSHVLPHHLYGFFTNHHLMSLVTLAVATLLLVVVSKRIAVDPSKGTEGYVTKGRVAQAIETICVFLRDEMTKPLLGKLTDKYIFYIWSIFWFILIGNLLGMIPISAALGLINPAWGHVGGTMTGNIAFTGGLAVLSFIAMHGIALKENGFHYIKHCFPVPMKPAWLIPLLLIVNILVGFLELILGPLIKAFALAIRLFANMVAGHLVLGSLIILAISAPAFGKGAGVVGAAVFSFLELFVSFLQAYVFTFLTVIFISLGAISHDEHDENEAGLDEGELPGEAAAERLTGTQSHAH